ncbi:MAG: hypothetical protein V4586_15165 [Pseudomonadota bacterium]
MVHTLLYRLERNPKKCLTGLGLLFLILTVMWVILAAHDSKFPMEPIVVFVGGSATLLASYWPWRPIYMDRRSWGRASFDYLSNNHVFTIGAGQLEFSLKFSKASDTSILLYSDEPNVEKIGLASDAGKFSDIADASVFEFTNRVVTAGEGQIVALINTGGNYALVHIHDVRDATRGDDRDEVTFSWLINPDRGTDFT